MDAADVVAELSWAFEHRDWEAMRKLYHADALILTVQHGPALLTADEIVRQLELASEDIVYSVNGSEATPLDEHAVVVTGRMRRRMPRGGFEDASHVWLLTVLDGLVYRQGVYADREAAVDAYRRCGIALGIGSD